MHESCTEPKLEENFPPGDEGAADGDGGWEGIYPQETLARADEGKDDKGVSCAAHLFGNIPL